MNNPMEGIEQLPEAQREALLAAIEEMQIRDSLRTYNKVVQQCFNDCVNSFKRKDLEKDEEACIQRCTEKFVNFSGRVGLRFGELSAQAEQQMQQLMQQQQAGKR